MGCFPSSIRKCVEQFEDPTFSSPWCGLGNEGTLFMINPRSNCDKRQVSTINSSVIPLTRTVHLTAQKQPISFCWSLDVGHPVCPDDHMRQHATPINFRSKNLRNGDKYKWYSSALFACSGQICCCQSPSVRNSNSMFILFAIDQLGLTVRAHWLSQLCPSQNTSFTNSVTAPRMPVIIANVIDFKKK